MNEQRPNRDPAGTPPFEPSLRFDQVLSQELDEIAKRRHAAFGGTEDNWAVGGEPADARQETEPGFAESQSRQRQRAANMNLVGLAFSGGGIRSATFNLGVLQGLADLGLLRYI